MSFTKEEQTILLGIVIAACEEEMLNQTLQSEQLEMLDNIFTDFSGNTTPNQIVGFTSSAIQKLLTTVLINNANGELPTKLEGSE